MPYAAKTPCRGGCGRLTSGGYCDGCKAKRVGSDRRVSSSKRGYGYRWQQASEGFRQAHPLCADPSKRHPDEVKLATQTDHVIPHRGDMRLFWDPKNWQALCDGCHSYKTATEDGGFGR